MTHEKWGSVGEHRIRSVREDDSTQPPSLEREADTREEREVSATQWSWQWWWQWRQWCDWWARPYRERTALFQQNLWPRRAHASKQWFAEQLIS